MDQTQDNFWENFTPISDEIRAYIDEDVFLESRYIFTYRIDNQLYGYCTHCRNLFPIYKSKKKKHNTLADILINIECFKYPFTHNTIADCPFCDSRCTVKSEGLGHKHLIDETYFVYYEKSAIDPQAIVARGIYAKRDYRASYRDVDTEYYVKAYYLFKSGQSRMRRETWFYNQDISKWELRYYDCSSVYPLFKDQWNHDGWRASLWYKIIPVSVCWESIRDAVTGTPFQYSTWGDYPQEMDMVKFFDLYSKYPSVEYLTKLGFDDLVTDKLRGFQTYGAINWRGKSVLSVLKLNKKDIREIKESNIRVDCLFLKLYQKSKKDGSNLSPAEVETIYDNYHGAIDLMMEVTKYTSLRRMNDYIMDQIKTDNLRRDPATKRIQGKNLCLRTWKDYIADCIQLGMDLNDTSVLYPRDLYTAHQNTIKQVKLKASKEADKKIKAHLKSLSKKYSFEFGELFIRPATGSEELIDEGAALNHCVGTYADRYAQGKTVLLVLRKTCEPEKPYFTVEIKGSSIIQCRGLRNCPPSEDVDKFIETFKKAKLEGQKTKVKVPA